MTDEEIKNIIFQLLKNIAPDTEPEKLKPNENIRKTLDIDSFDALQFLVALNKKLNIEIPEIDYGKTGTVQELMNYLKEKISK